tara:strand:- start:7210 stop:7734 length:525 start_codon:yes stop_codon:yes gene_type:complete
MPFLVQPFVMKLQTILDIDSSGYVGGAEGDNAEPIVVPGELAKQGPPLPPEKWARTWADATELGCAGLIPANAMLKVGWAAQYAVLLGSKSATPKHQVLKASFVAQALAIIPGFLPASAATPPSGEPNFDALDGIGMGSTTWTPWLNACGNMLNSWYMTGMQNYLPNGPVLTWL